MTILLTLFLNKIDHRCSSVDGEEPTGRQQQDAQVLVGAQWPLGMREKLRKLFGRRGLRYGLGGVTVPLSGLLS